MQRYFLILIAGVALCGGCSAGRPMADSSRHWMADKAYTDAVNFYSPKSLVLLGGGLGTGATLAHTPADEELRDWYQQEVRSDDTDRLARFSKTFGEGPYVLAAAGTCWAAGALLPEVESTSALGRWGERSTRSLMVGVPPLLLMQVVTGASRPGENSAGSDWAPFLDSNGVSGHAFMGAVPLLTAAHMTDNFYLKSLCYAGSAACGWSRVNDDAHYLSQAVLGWWMAHLACSAVAGTEHWQRQYEFVPLLTPQGGAGIGFVWRR